MIIKEVFRVVGLDCVDCAKTLEKGVSELSGVKAARVSFTRSTLEVEYAPELDRSAMLKRAGQLGYELRQEDVDRDRFEPTTIAGDLTFDVENLDCADCALHLEQALSDLPGVAEAKLDFMSARLRIVLKNGGKAREAVQARAREMGHPLRLQTAAAMPNPKAHAQSRRPSFIWSHRRDAASALSGLAIVLGLVAGWLQAPHPWPPVFFALAILAGGFYVARAAWVGVRTTRSLDMNVLMTLAALGAMVIGEWLEGALVMFLFSLGNTLEGYTVNRARNAIRTLMDLSPREAIRLVREQGDQSGHRERQERVSVAELQVGDLILVLPGDRISMDGVIESGISGVNQAPVTGESLPVERTAGDPVYAGTINGRGVLTVRVNRLAADNTIARIIRLVEEAQSQRAPSQRFVDAFARYYTPAVVGLAAAVAVLPPLAGMGGWHDWLYRALVLLVIGCPCALVISTPVTIVSAIASAARAGVLIKGGAFLERLGSIRAVAFDKTGTLTEGNPRVVAARCADHLVDPTALDCRRCSQMLANAAAVESQSEHPLAHAVVEEANRRGYDWSGNRVENVEALSGKGVRGQVNGETITVGSHRFSHEQADGLPHEADFCEAIEAAQSEGGTVMVVDCSSCGVQGYISVADTLRPDAARAVAALKQAGIRHTIMLTGDNASTAAFIQSQVGVDEYRAELLPENKVAAIEELIAQHGEVAMVGDGINDAPALARATVGIAMGAAGSATALETADVALMGDNLMRLPFAILLGRRTLGILKQNIAFALAIKVVFFALALAGAATLWMAVFADVGASMIVILNGMRLLQSKAD